MDRKLELPGDQPRVFTIGHSTRSLEEMIQVLNAYGVNRLIDIRTVPRSKHNPQFNQDTFPGALEAVGIQYTGMPGLGGFRKPVPGSINNGWRNESFQGYADYMQTAEFESRLLELVHFAQQDQIVLMCAETLPWRCHRSLVADALTLHGIQVVHVISQTQSQLHRRAPWAKVEGLRIFYPPNDAPGTDDQ
jgi:uncharacterized protein (DUF488 family)